MVVCTLHGQPAWSRVDRSSRRGTMDRFGFPMQAFKGMVTPMLPTFDPNQTAHFIAFRQFVEFFCAQFKDPHLVDDVNCRQSYENYILNYFCRIFTAGEDDFAPREVV